MRKQQFSLFDHLDKGSTKKRYNRKSHGGSLAKRKRKLERPLSTKQWIHLNLKSDKAWGKLSFLLPKNKTFINKLLNQKASRFGIKIGDRVNVGNHIHLKIKISSRENFQNFLRSITALIARKVTGATRGKPFGKFWSYLAFTRVLTTYREEIHLRGYFLANRLEAAHGYADREEFLGKYRAWAREHFSSA